MLNPDDKRTETPYPISIPPKTKQIKLDPLHKTLNQVWPDEEISLTPKPNSYPSPSGFPLNPKIEPCQRPKPQIERNPVQIEPWRRTLISAGSYEEIKETSAMLCE
ncbi:hypothetical protein Droror1_Dr00015883 [Drosera rotundifolia]